MTTFSTTTRIVKCRHRAIVLFYSILPENWTVNREDLERGSVVLVVSTKWRNISLVSRERNGRAIG